MAINRRDFLRNSLIGAGALSLPGMSLAFAPTGKSVGGQGVLVSIYLRGGADGLSIVVPHADDDYYRLRPTLAITRPGGGLDSALDLDGFFGLNPAFESLQPLFDTGELAIIHACGATHGSRSHFDAQELMERGVSSKSGAFTGWLGRAVETLPSAGLDPFISAAMGTAVPRSLSGLVAPLGISGIEGFDLALDGKEKTAARYLISNGPSAESDFGGVALQTLEAVDLLKQAQPAQFATDPTADYPTGGLAQHLMQLAQLIKSDIGLRAAGVDLGGWDHHQNQANVLPELLQELGASLAAFQRDLGVLSENVSVVVMSEFGRRAFQNGSAGTDHGSGNIMLVMGGGVNGGQVYSQWPGLRDSDLVEGDLKITTDYRQVLRELLAARLPEADADHAFPDHAAGQAIGLFG